MIIDRSRAADAAATLSTRPRRRCAARAALALLLAGCGGASGVRFDAAGAALAVRQPALYPETLEYDATRDTFLVSSMRDGAIYRVDAAGLVSPLVDDPRLCSVLGIALDAERGRVWAVNSDLGASRRPSASGPRQLAAVGVYDLASGEPVAYVDLAPLVTGPHLLNGIALDAAGNAYVTDSFSPVIYRVDAGGQASVLIQSERFAGEGINLNGLVVHPGGYLLVVKKSEGALFKVPLDRPAAFTRVAIDTPLFGGDGVIRVGERGLVIVANQVPGNASNAAFALSSADGWASARLDAARPLGDVYPTTGVLRDGDLYVISSHLNELIQAPADQKAALHAQAVIQRIGRVAP